MTVTASPCSFSKINDPIIPLDQRIKPIICQIRHELSVTIHEINTSWKKTFDGGPYKIELLIQFCIWTHLINVLCVRFFHKWVYFCIQKYWKWQHWKTYLNTNLKINILSLCQSFFCSTLKKLKQSAYGRKNNWQNIHTYIHNTYYNSKSTIKLNYMLFILSVPGQTSKRNTKSISSAISYHQISGKNSENN